MIKFIKKILPDKYDKCYKIQENRMHAVFGMCSGVKSKIITCKECKYYVHIED